MAKSKWYWFSFSYKGKNQGCCNVEAGDEESALQKTIDLDIHPKHDDIEGFEIKAAELEPDRLISMVAENTRTFGDIVLAGLKEGQALEAISHRIGDHFISQYGRKVNETDVAVIVGGYAIYFNSKGLV